MSPEHTQSDPHREPDSFQQAWRAQSAQTRVTVNADSLLKVGRNQQDLRTAIGFRDFVEIGSALVMLPMWIFLGVMTASPWTWYLMAPVFVWTIGVTLWVRARRKRRPVEPGEPLLKSVQESLALVEHQIWWMRNSFWWSQLPSSIAMLVFFAHCSSFSLIMPSDGWFDTAGHVAVFVLSFGSLSAVVFAVYGSVYFLNQRVISKTYEPQRQELLALLASLRDEPTSEGDGEYPILMSEKRGNCSCSPRRMFVASLCFVVIMFIVAGMVLFMSRHSHPERSPFAAVRWQQSQPEVKVGDEWFTLVSLDELPASEIVAFSQRTYGNRWRKRFEEDLVAVLTGMGAEPKATVRLVVMRLGSQETRTLEDVPMTSANRQAIREAAQAREQNERQPATPVEAPAKPVSVDAYGSTGASPSLAANFRNRGAD